MTDDDALPTVPDGIEFKGGPGGGCVYDPENQWAYLSMTHYVNLEEWR